MIYLKEEPVIFQYSGLSRASVMGILADDAGVVPEGRDLPQTLHLSVGEQILRLGRRLAESYINEFSAAPLKEWWPSELTFYAYGGAELCAGVKIGFAGLSPLGQPVKTRLMIGLLSAGRVQLVFHDSDLHAFMQHVRAGRYIHSEIVVEVSQRGHYTVKEV